MFEAFMSPGAVTEKLHFFVAEYDASMRIGDGGGLADEGEDIEVLELPIDEALAMIADGRIVDAKTIMLLQYAALNIFQVSCRSCRPGASAGTHTAAIRVLDSSVNNDPGSRAQRGDALRLAPARRLQNKLPCPSSSAAARRLARGRFFGFGASASRCSSVIGSTNCASSLATRLTRVEISCQANSPSSGPVNSAITPSASSARQSSQRSKSSGAIVTGTR